MSNTTSIPLNWENVAGALFNARPVAVAAAGVLLAHYFLFAKKSTASKEERKERNEKSDHCGDGTLLEAASHLALVIFSHSLCYYLWWAAEFNKGCLGNPFPLDVEVIEKATPNATTIGMYFGLISSQLLFSFIMPGPKVLGFKIPQENNRRLEYHTNALAGWYASIVIATIAHCTGLFDFKLLFRNGGAMLTTAIIFSDSLAVIMYLECLRTRRSDGSINDFMHDFVMGQYLNPRIGKVDLKMWAEVRVSWLLLFSLEVSCALCLRQELGYIPNRMWIILLIHGLYTNACMKGEESIPYTWDIFQERWGWMLIYWNLAGVAFAYTFNGRFVYATANEIPDLPMWGTALLAVGVIAAYWVFDVANAQKNRFRAQQLSGAYIERPWAFPQLPGATLENPKYLTTKKGSTLLIDGWWGVVRKPHYTADLCLALLLCLPCGFDHFLPYFFVCFFAPMLIHRAYRDAQRCQAKYGKDWDIYCETVPYQMFPGIY